MMSIHESEPYSKKMRRDRRRHCIEAKNALFEHRHSFLDRQWDSTQLPRLCETTMKSVCTLHLFGRSKSTRANREGGTGRCDDGHDWDNVL